MYEHYLTKLFTPKSLAIFGASDRENSVGGIVFRNLLASNYKGVIYPINPKHETIQEQKAYPSLEAIEKIPDLAVIATPAMTIPAIMEACGEKGIKMALILSAGFREIGHQGLKLEQQVVQIAKQYDIRLMGPNCLGIIRPDIGLNVTFGHNNALPGNIALVSQSGAICTAILDWAEKNDIGLSSVVSTGIAADLDFGDYLDYLVSDPKTHSILLYIEGIKDSRRFMSSIRAAARMKPVIALKVGRNPAGAEASMSHTGALVGRDDVFSAALSRSGVVRVQSVSQLFAAAKALSSPHYRKSGERLAIITNGGGPGVMAADRATDLGIELTQLSDDLMKNLNDVLPDVWSHSNPIDIIGDAPPERYQQAIDICLEDPRVDGAIVILTPQAMTKPTEVAEAVIKISKKHKKPILVSWMGGKQVQEARRLFNEARIPSFSTLEHAVEGFSFMQAYNRNQRMLLQTPPKLRQGLKKPDTEGARLIIESALMEKRNVLTEPESIAVLRAFNIPAVQIAIAKSASEALIFAETIGFPIAMKVLSNDISHKSDAGGVRLNIETAQDVRRVYGDLMNSVKTANPEATIEGVTIEKMVRSSNARELMIGLVRDPVFGPVISFGSGGTSVEIIRDSAVSLPPLNLRLSNNLIDSTRVSKLLAAHRDKPAANRDLLVDVLLHISNMACELPWIEEMDINPLLLDDKQAIAVDARIRVDYPQASTEPYHHLAIHPYPEHMITQVQLNDGTDIEIRPIRPEDAKIEQDFIRSLSNESRYFRFMNSINELSPEMLTRFTRIDYHNEMALIVVVKDGAEEREIAVARYLINPDKKSCEFAIVVADQWQGRGIAHTLMGMLIDNARERKMKIMESSVLSENNNMLKLVTKLGFTVENEPEDPSVKNVFKHL